MWLPLKIEFRGVFNKKATKKRGQVLWYISNPYLCFSTYLKTLIQTIIFHGRFCPLTFTFIIPDITYEQWITWNFKSNIFAIQDSLDPPLTWPFLSPRQLLMKFIVVILVTFSCQTQNPQCRTSWSLGEWRMENKLRTKALIETLRFPQNFPLSE